MVREECWDQGDTPECGVYTCMWIKCLACDTDEIWVYQMDVNVSAYRAHVAAFLLSDANGLLRTV